MIKVSIVLIAKFIDQKDFVLNVVAIARKEGEFKVISLLMAPGLHTMSYRKQIDEWGFVSRKRGRPKAKCVRCFAFLF